MGSDDDGDEHHITLEDNTSPSSSSSSPSPEFSFTGSLWPCETKSLSPSSVDLSPADDIFFNGHLLPLQILSHIPRSPPSSMNLPHKFSLPKESFDGRNPQEADKNCSCSNGDNVLSRIMGTDPRFWFTLPSLMKWRRGSETEGGESEKKACRKRRARFEVNLLLRRCTSIVRRVAILKGRSEKAVKEQFAREPYRSYSENLSLKHDISDLKGHKGEHSAHVSSRTSPTNSAFVVPTNRLSSSASDSSMDEFQAAIEAAIAHCKKSFCIEEQVKKS